MKYDCPSCGQPFNGKKCKNCGYETFDEEIAHRMHTHKGEPLIIKDTSRMPIPTQDPFGCPPTPKKKKQKSITPGLIIALCLFGTVGMNFLSRFPFMHRPAFTFDFGSPNVIQETAQAVPVYPVGLYDDGSFSISAQWDGSFQEEIPMYLYSSRDVRVTVKNLTINGFCMNDYCYMDGDITKNIPLDTTLYIDSDGLDLCQVQTVQTMTLELELRDPDTWAVRETLSPLSFPITPTQGYVQGNCEDGPVLFDKDGLKIVYRGAKLLYEDTPSEAEFYLYIENETDDDLYIYTQNSKIGNLDISLPFGTNLPAHSKTVTRTIAGEATFGFLSDIPDITTELWYLGQNTAVGPETITLPKQ